MPEPLRTGPSMEIKTMWKVYYPDRDATRKSQQNETHHQNGTTISKEKSTDDIEMIMLNKQNGKRKHKSGADDQTSNKPKNKRYRRGCVADEVPSTIILDNDEEPGEIADEATPVIEPFKYEPIDEETILSKSESIEFRLTKSPQHWFSVLTEKFKRPADDEDIYDPNRQKKSSTVRAPRRPGAQQTNKSLSYPFPKKT